MTTKCLITFDNNPEGVYYSGQILAGTIKLTTVKPKLIRAIYITIDGRAKVRWTERKSHPCADGKTTFYTEPNIAYEQYLSYRKYVLDHDHSTDHVLPIGIHTYTFQVLLPHHLPSSFTGRHGNILYEVKLTIDRPMSFDNDFRQPFTVISQLDLNTNPSYKIPIEMNNIKEIICGCFIMQPLVIKAIIPYSGYAPGQRIPITVSVNNDSSNDCNEVKIKLNKIVQFTARHPYSKIRYDTIKIFEKRLPQVLRGSRKKCKEYIPLPSIAPSTLETCSIIHVSYNIEVTGKIPGFQNYDDINLPITIGTVPIYENVINPPNVITMQPTGLLSGSDDDLPPPYIPMMPPTYEEATAAYVVPFEEDDDEQEGHIKEASFTPKYPVYYNVAVARAPLRSRSLI